MSNIKTPTKREVDLFCTLSRFGGPAFWSYEEIAWTASVLFRLAVLRKLVMSIRRHEITTKSIHNGGAAKLSKDSPILS